MSQWVGIESAAQPAPDVQRAAQASGAKRPLPRLRRTERLIVGSIDGAAHVLQRKARDVLLGSAVFMVPMVGLNVLLAILAFNEFDTFDNVLGDRGYIGAETGFVFFAIAVESFTAHLIGAYAAVYLVRYQMGGNPRIRDCVWAVVRRLPLLVITWLLTHWWALLLDLLVINQEASSLGWLIYLLPVAAVFSALTLLVTPVMMAEHRGVRSISRAWRLVRTRFGAAYGFVFACGILATLLFSFIAFLPVLAESTGLVTFGSFGWLLQGVTSQIALLVVVPFSAIATAQLYLQIRVHAEGMDIAMAADRAFGERA